MARRCTLCILVGRKVVWKEHGQKPSRVVGARFFFFFFFSLFIFYYSFVVLFVWLIATWGNTWGAFFSFCFVWLWCCIVSIDYNKNFFVFSRASHQVRLSYAFGLFHCFVVMVFVSHRTTSMFVLFCFLVLWLCLWLLLLPFMFMLTTFCYLLLLLFSHFEFVPLGVVFFC